MLQNWVLNLVCHSELNSLYNITLECKLLAECSLPQYFLRNESQVEKTKSICTYFFVL